MDNPGLLLLLCPFGFFFYQEGLTIYPVMMKRKMVMKMLLMMMMIVTVFHTIARSFIEILPLAMF